MATSSEAASPIGIANVRAYQYNRDCSICERLTSTSFLTNGTAMSNKALHRLLTTEL